MTWRSSAAASGSCLALCLVTLASVACGGGTSASPDAAADASSPLPDGGVATVVPAETADEAALLELGDWRGLPARRDGSYRLQSSRDTGAGDPLPYPLFASGNRDMNHFLCASADAEAEPQLLAFLYEETQCPESYVKGYVLARFEGSGRLARLWMAIASLAKGGTDESRALLRIYVDDEQEPLVQVPIRALADGTAGEIFAPPFGAGTASFVAWYYPVVFSHRLILSVDRLSALTLLYHQEGVVLDAVPGARQRASERLDARDHAAATLAARAAGPIAGLDPLEALAPVLLAPGVSTSVATLVGPGTIQTLQVRIPETDLVRLSDVDVTVSWDGAVVPAIDLSLAQLLAASGGVPGQPSLALAAAHADGLVSFALRLPMPFATRADWALRNHGSLPVTLEFGLDGETGPIVAGLGRLHVLHHSTVGPTAQTYHPIASVQGSGRLVGVCLTMAGHAFAEAGSTFASGYNFLEGDERIVVDGTHTLEGTGTEDYVDSAFYFKLGEAGTAFAQAWGLGVDTTATPETAHVSACRWHVLSDAVDFSSSLDVDLEIGPAQPQLLDRYESVAFVYLSPP